MYLQDLATVSRQIAQFLQLDLVRLSLIQVGQRLFVHFRCDARGSGKHVLETVKNVPLLLNVSYIRCTAWRKKNVPAILVELGSLLRGGNVISRGRCRRILLVRGVKQLMKTSCGLPIIVTVSFDRAVCVVGRCRIDRSL